MLKRFLIIFCLVISFIFTFTNSSFAYIDQTGPHWEKSPINVFISSNNQQSTQIKNAFQAWQNASENKIKFVYTNNEKISDIIVKFNSTINDSKNSVARADITIKDKAIIKGEITIFTNKIANVNNKIAENIFLHNIGLTIGLPLNERKPSSIMCPNFTESQRILKKDVIKLYKIYGWSYYDRRFEH